MVQIDKLEVIETVSLTLPLRSSAIVPLATINSATIAAEYNFAEAKYRVNPLITELRAFATIRSINEAPFPDITDFDSRTNQIIKATNIEWKSDRKQMRALIRKSGSNAWVKLGAVSLQRAVNIPYKEYNILRLFTRVVARPLGQGDSIGLSLEEVGFGLLDGLDEVVIDGSIAHQFIIFQENSAVSISAPSFDYATGSSGSELDIGSYSAEVVPANSIAYKMKNTGNKAVFIELGNDATTNSLLKLVPGAIYESEAETAKLAVNAICNASEASKLLIRRFT